MSDTYNIHSSPLNLKAKMLPGQAACHIKRTHNTQLSTIRHNSSLHFRVQVIPINTVVLQKKHAHAMLKTEKEERFNVELTS
jgi:hypothetical protein